ncbi:hypothetical protein [Magnetospirillum sp. 64-120]|uniref:hypothetical protein n=1 Tax=Magnetospirillum sp. 64-120 TaxID=1895778 RepID=UPI00092B7AFF|nr:hypothetical protein [Magnetospirillum sp. 64-120]OJX70439.1 MAG: hypothetical protein BGO92_17825 [Magnetospirillum sp. 64-120]
MADDDRNAEAALIHTPDQNGIGIQGKDRKRVEQIYTTYLDAVYATDYFSEVHRATMTYGRFFDFAIGLGAAISGGSGLGILAHPSFAWLCAVITTLSIILTVAKSSYDWPGKMKMAAEMTEKYGTLSGKYQMLIEDINYVEQYSEKFEKIFQKLREEQALISTIPSPVLGEEKQREIQAAIKKRIPYKDWWRPQ